MPTLQRMRLVLVMRMTPRDRPTVTPKMPHASNLGILIHKTLIHITQHLQRELNSIKQAITPIHPKVLPDNNPHHLQRAAIRRHRVSRHNPPALAQLVRQRELVEVGLIAVLVGQAEGDEGQAVAAALAHDDEAELGEFLREVVGDAGEVDHDGAVAAFAEADHLVVLADYLRGALGEV